jgi:hypothetical protein
MSHFQSTPRSVLSAVRRPPPQHSITQSRGGNVHGSLVPGSLVPGSRDHRSETTALTHSRPQSVLGSGSGLASSFHSSITPAIPSSQRTLTHSRSRSRPVVSWEVIFRSLTVTYVLLTIWLVLMTIASWLQRYCQIRPDEFPICRAIALASTEVGPESRTVDKPVPVPVRPSKIGRDNVVTTLSRTPNRTTSVRPPVTKSVEFMEPSMSPSAHTVRSLTSIPPVPPRDLPRPTVTKLMKLSDVVEGPDSQRVQHELFQELESYFLRGNKFKPSSIRHFKGNKTDRAPNLPIDHDIVVYGRGPIAYSVVHHLIKQNHDVILITPDSYEVTTHYLIGSGAHIDIPNSIRFYLEDLRVTSATPEELANLADASGVPIPIVKRIYEEFITSLEMVESTPQADAMIDELNSTVTPIRTYRLNLQTRYQVPEKVIRRGLVKSFSEKLAGTYVEILFELDLSHERVTLHQSQIQSRPTHPGIAASTEQILRCRKFILADEFLPTIPALWPIWLKAAPKLSGPFGYQFESFFPSVPFSKVVLAGSAQSSMGSAIISMHHTGEVMTISVSQVFPYLRLETGGYYLKASVVHRSDPVIESQLRQILRELGDESSDPASESQSGPPIEPINLTGGSWGLRPTGLVSCHKHYRLENYQSVWIVGPLFLPATRDWIRDTCIIAAMIDRIIALT